MYSNPDVAACLSRFSLHGMGVSRRCFSLHFDQVRAISVDGYRPMVGISEVGTFFCITMNCDHMVFSIPGAG